MSAEVPENADSRSTSFRQISDAFLSQGGLAFSEVLTAEKIQRVFGRNHALFGMNGVYSTAIVLLAFLSQTLNDGKEASCQSAIARIARHSLEVRVEPPTNDTPDYCKARARLSRKAVHELSNEVAADLEQQADETWSWKHRHAKLIVGFTFTMSGTSRAALLGGRKRSPHMVRRESWTTLLAFNLIRTAAANAPVLHGAKPRQISFTSTRQYVLESWQPVSGNLYAAAQIRRHCLTLPSQIADCEVANCADRFEPRVLRRRRHAIR